VIGEQQEPTPGAHPLHQLADFVLGERGRMRIAPVVGVRLGQRVGNDQQFAIGQGVPSERGREAGHPVPVTTQQLRERFVAPVGGVEVVVGFVNADPRAVARGEGRRGIVELKGVVASLLRDRRERRHHHHDREPFHIHDIFYCRLAIGGRADLKTTKMQAGVANGET
jgi:hypothetical protein